VSKWAGKVRRALLAIFADDPKPLSSYDLTERVYGVRPDRAGDVWLTDGRPISGTPQRPQKARRPR